VGYYVYCVVPASQRAPEELQGLNGSSVYSKALGDLAIWVSEVERPQPGAEAATAHNRVVEAAVTEEVTPVPIRFGQWAPEFAAIEQAIVGRAAWYRERLDEFAGALEFGVRVVDPTKQKAAQVLRTETGITGREYMNALRERAAAAQSDRAEVERIAAAAAQILGPHVRATKVEEPGTAHGLVNIVHLVARDRFESYRAAVDAVKTAFPELRFLLSGPWVPYSFAV